MILNQDILKIVFNGNIEELNKVSKEFYYAKRHEHKKFGNAHSIITSLGYFIEKAENNKFNKLSYYLALIHKFNSQLLLDHATSKLDLNSSLYHINKTIDILSLLKLNDKGANALISSHLIRAVLLKVLNKKDEAIYSIRNSKKELRKLEEKGKTLIKLNRQEQIIHQTKLSHKKLLNEAIDIYSKDKIEFYSSLKRLFEFYLNNKMYDKSIQYYSIFIDSFTNISHRLPYISKVSFMKNIGQYNIEIGNEKEAMRLLTVALKKSIDLNLTGQIMQIKNLIKSISSKEKAKLLTYNFENK